MKRTPNSKYQEKVGWALALMLCSSVTGQVTLNEIIHLKTLSVQGYVIVITVIIPADDFSIDNTLK